MIKFLAGNILEWEAMPRVLELCEAVSVVELDLVVYMENRFFVVSPFKDPGRDLPLIPERWWAVPVLMPCVVHDGENVTFGQSAYATLRHVNDRWHYQLVDQDGANALQPLAPYMLFEVGHVHLGP